jgi:Ca2+-binding RTX toxin-like protein
MRSTTLIESLETRRLFDTSLSNGVLVVLGTSGDDEVTFQENETSLIVTLNDDDDTYDRSAVSVILVDVGRGADSVVLGNRNIRAQIKGGRGNDTISAGNNRDTIYAEGGDDYIFGGAGNDVIDPGGEQDLIIGGDGPRDLVDYSWRTNDLDIDISGDDEDDGEAGENDSVMFDVEIVLGGSGDDDLAVASGRRTTLVGGSGDDTLTGGSNVNVFDGGAGNDLAFGFGGNDVFWFEDGQGDTIHGGSGDDVMDVDNELDVATGIERNI